MQRRMSVQEMMSFLNRQEINTWFDLGLFIDHVKETNPVPVVESKTNFDEFLDDIRKGGLAFITFHFTIDGVTIEAEKYSNILRNSLNIKKIHYISGQFYPGSEQTIHPKTKRF